MYLVAALDWYTRYVISWELDQTLELPVCLDGTRTCSGSSDANHL